MELVNALEERERMELFTAAMEFAFTLASCRFFTTWTRLQGHQLLGQRPSSRGHVTLVGSLLRLGHSGHDGFTAAHLLQPGRDLAQVRPDRGLWRQHP